VIVGGGGGARRTPRLAARFADEFNMPFASLAATARQFARVGPPARPQAATPPDPRDLREHAVARHPWGGRGPAAGLADDGASRAYLQVLDLDDLEHLHLLAAEVAPQLP
jgi:hypothetical protein